MRWLLSAFISCSPVAQSGGMVLVVFALAHHVRGQLFNENVQVRDVPAVKSSDEFAKEKTLPVKKREGSL